MVVVSPSHVKQVRDTARRDKSAYSRICYKFGRYPHVTGAFFWRLVYARHLPIFGCRSVRYPRALLRLSFGLLAPCRRYPWRSRCLARPSVRSLYPGSFDAASAGEALVYARFFVLLGLYDGFFARGVFLYTLYLFCPLGAFYGGLNG